MKTLEVRILQELAKPSAPCVEAWELATTLGASRFQLVAPFAVLSAAGLVEGVGSKFQLTAAGLAGTATAVATSRRIAATVAAMKPRERTPLTFLELVDEVWAAP